MSKQEKKTQAEPTVAVETLAAGDPVSEAPPANTDNYEQTAALAYSYWEARGCPEGSSEEDWYRAESDLRKPAAKAASAA
jgi:hypothetical protein